MSTIALFNTIHVDEDTTATVSLRDILAGAGYTTAAPLKVRGMETDLPDGDYADGESPLLGLADSEHLLVSPGAWAEHYNGEFVTYQFLVEDQTDGNYVTLALRVVIDPVNDAPSGADRSFDLASHDPVLLSVDDFGFADAVEGDAFKSVIVETLPAAGTIRLDGKAVANGAEIDVADIAAGKLSFVPSATSGGIVELAFHVRDNGGTAGTGARDTSIDTNYLTFKVPSPPGNPGTGAPALASIGDTVWQDANANGIQDAGEAGLANVTVALRDGAGKVVDTVSTDANGHYSFSVGAGTYTVAVTAPAGYVATTRGAGGNGALDSDIGADGVSNPISVVRGDVVTDVDAGLYRTASLGNRVWHDCDGDGVQDAGESGIRGMQVTLLDQQGKALAVTSTDATGQYAFTGLKPGTYSVQFDDSALPSGYLFTKANAGGNDALDSDVDALGRSHQVTLAAGANNTSVDAGVTRAATIGDRVWFDADGDGVQGFWEGGVANVVMTLTNARGDVVATTKTDACGYYGFSVAAGTYHVSMKTPDGYAVTKQHATFFGSFDSNADAAGNLGTVTVRAGEAVHALDAGLVQAKTAIRSTVWEDSDFDGVQDKDECGIGGVTVKLYDASHKLKATTVTAADGSYAFDKLAAGSYSVEVTRPSGWFTTRANVGSDALDSDFTNIGTSALAGSGLFTLASGQQKTDLDAGLYRKASIGDKVWRDANHNGVQDKGEEGIGKIKVMLYDATTNKLLASTTTNSAGNYLFDDLDPGSYYLKFDKTNVKFTDARGYSYALNDWKWGAKNAGGNDLLDSDVKGDALGKTSLTQTDATFLSSGENDMRWDAAITPIAIDLDGNGIHTIARAAFTGSFDLLGSGSAIKSGWLSAGDAFLAIDANGNGRIDDISELFGGASKGSGFARLASFDSNGDGFVTAGDAQFAALTLWQDANGNGVTDAGELFSLAQAGVTSLAVAFEELPFLDANGNLHLERSSAVVNGHAVSMTDVYFNVASADVAGAGLQAATMAQLIGQGDIVTLA